ncbi:MAG: cyclic nucleotide-binding domain-containing protein [Clostridia bacterium]|nr:cyclic nucleotide-binding domain-containing protein [Clostridia bacterium]
MKIIQDSNQLKHYVSKYNIHQFFEKDMTPYMTLCQYPYNEMLLNTGDLMKDFYFVVEGKVKIFLTLENGKSLLLRIVHPLTELGSVELLQEQKIVSSNVQALHQCKVIKIPFKALEEHAKEDLVFYKYIIRQLSRKLHNCSNTASINATYPFKSRLASYLISTATPIDADTIDEIRFEHLTDLATFLGTSYRHLNRVVQELCDEKIIQKNKNSFTIINYEQLKTLSGGFYE